MTKEFVLSALVIDVISLLGRDQSMNSVYFASNKVPYFSRFQEVTIDETVFRLFASLTH